MKLCLSIVLLPLLTAGLYAATIHFLREYAKGINDPFETEKTKREMYVDEVSIGMRILPQNEIITSEAKQKVRKIVDSTRRKCYFGFSNLQAVKVTQQLQNDTQQGAMAYLEVVRPSGHLTAGKHHHYYPTKGENTVKYWYKTEGGSAFLCSKTDLQNNALVVPVTGRYYVYSQVKFRYLRKAPPTLHRHTLYMWPQGDSSLEFPVVENNYYLGNDTEAIEEMEEKVSYHGLVVLAERGSMFLVKTQAAGSRSTLVIERDVDTFFGMYMVS